VRILEDQWKWDKWNMFFNVQHIKVVCSLGDFFSQANGIAGFGGLNPMCI
jgi:hypothetical protein